MASRIIKRKDDDRYILFFHNPIDTKKNKKHLKSSKDLDILKEKASELDAAFYKKHTYLLPSGITLDTGSNRFRVYTRFGYISSHKTLREAIEVKNQILDDLTKLRFDVRNKQHGLII